MSAGFRRNVDNSDPTIVDGLGLMMAVLVIEGCSLAIND